MIKPGQNYPEYTYSPKPPSRRKTLANILMHVVEITLIQKCNTGINFIHRPTIKIMSQILSLDAYTGLPLISVIATHMHLREEFGTPCL